MINPSLHTYFQNGDTTLGDSNLALGRLIVHILYKWVKRWMLREEITYPVNKAMFQVQTCRILGS